MNCLQKIGVLFFLAAVSALGGAADSLPPQPLTIEEYRSELQRIESGVEGVQSAQQVVALHKSIPEQYKVVAKDRSVILENADLKKLVGGLAAEKDREQHRVALEQRLKAIAAGTVDFEHAEDTAPAHAKLTKILDTSEFSEVRGPTLLEVWRDKIIETISRWWDKAMQKIPSPGGGHQEFAWIVIAIGLSILAIWLKRIYDRREPELPREVIPFAPSGKHWRTWLGEARAAAEEGHWREAVHLAYWAGISHLESSGAWSPDNARTPREYLRLIQPNNPSRGELVALTRDFERIWYGSQSAGGAEFSESLLHLERLGCR